MIPASKQRSYGITCLITFLICYSLVFWVTGVILLGAGMWVKLSTELPEFLQQYIKQYPLASGIAEDGPYLLIGIGITIIILGLYGCLATCYRHPLMLKVFAFFSAIVLLCEVGAGISGFLHRDKLTETFVVAFQTAISSYNTSSSNRAVVDYTQKNFRCCGERNFTDWGSIAYFTENGIPHSCCKVPVLCTSENLKNLTRAQNMVHNRGCVAKIINAFNSNPITFGIISFTIASFQLLGICLTYCYARIIIKIQHKMF